VVLVVISSNRVTKVVNEKPASNLISETFGLISCDEFFAPSPAVRTIGSPLQIVKKTQHYPQQTNFFSVNVPLTCGIIYRTTLCVLIV